MVFRTVGAVVCPNCLLVYSTYTGYEPITINGNVYKPENPLLFCSVCNLSLKFLPEDRLSELVMYRHRSGKHGY
jgi:hypothetical protein